MGRFFGAAVFGVVGVAILLSLGVWQVSRLEWKEALIAGIEARIDNDPVPVPDVPQLGADRFLPVTVDGRFTGETVEVLSSMRGVGPGVRIIAVLETTEGRRLLVDRGYTPEGRRDDVILTGESSIVGNLDWPEDSDSFTPDPDLARGLWFSRAPEAIAAHLEAEPFLIVARQDSAAASPLLTVPLDTAGIKNDHLEYAITWFSLALVWAVMTIALLWRIRRPTA
jgi:surfeit locus 1 family protein